MQKNKKTACSLLSTIVKNNEHVGGLLYEQDHLHASTHRPHHESMRGMVGS
jgi:hypothetical protein